MLKLEKRKVIQDRHQRVKLVMTLNLAPDGE
jgi:hypothetical protein